MAKELAPHGIRVNNLCPGIINTQMQDDLDDSYGKTSGKVTVETVRSHVEEKVALKQYGTPGDVAKVVAFLAGEAGSYVTDVIYANVR